MRPLEAGARDEALALCARNPAANVFVASRILEGALTRQPGALLGYYRGKHLAGMAWSAANIVPVELDQDGIEALAYRVRRWRRQCASLFGPSTQVEGLWQLLEESWGPPRAIRHRQPLMAASQRPSLAGMPVDARVRFARPDEVDIVLPAAAHMFTEEIGYPPYYGSDRGYRAVLTALIASQHTMVRVEDGQVVFKADVGSVAQGAAQLQGVWLHPSLSGQGLAPAPLASLYVNDFNIAARATYLRCGYREVGTFSTVLL